MWGFVHYRAAILAILIVGCLGARHPQFLKDFPDGPLKDFLADMNEKFGPTACSGQRYQFVRFSNPT